MTKEFERAYEALNKEQKQAVDAIDGPVLVIAGPGTGKTQLLSARVANILKITDAKPANILCLTFTNKAAVNMKSRIIELAGPAGAKVAASTFHSFAAEIMNIYPDYFWNSAKLSVAPETLQLDIIESIVAKLPFDNPLALKFAGQYTLLKDIQQAINLTKQAGLTPDKLRAIINANLAYIDLIEASLAEVLSARLSFKALMDFRNKVDSLPKQEIDEYIYPLASLSTVITDSLDRAIEKDGGSGKCSNTSKWKSRWIQQVDGQRTMGKERDRNIWWLKLADVYEHYRNALHQKGFYDYADMLVEVISQLEQNSSMLADIQERFSYVLIDEFQDTTPAQLRLAHLTAEHHTNEGKPNLMAVGDDDQTIYKFSGAELNNMLGFKRTYPSAKIIILSSNYRSGQAILDTAQKIISQAESRLVDSDPQLKKVLVPAKNLNTKVEATSYSSRELQLSAVAKQIKKNYRPDRDFAVLARSHDSLQRMAAVLTQLEVPVRYEQATNILSHELINQVYLIGRLLLAINEGDKTAVNALTHQIIRWPTWGIKPDDLWRIALKAKQGEDWLELTSKSTTELKTLSSWFLWLASQAETQPLSITIEQIIGLRPSGQFTSPVRDYFTRDQSGTNEYFHGLSAIQLLRALVHEFAAGQEPTLANLVRFMEINQQNGLIVADESPFITGAHGVQLLTVHKAKGLEFDDVYIIDATEDTWQARKGGRKPPANLPLQPPLDEFDDYVRLMYVAVTRAKSALSISSYYQDHSGKDVAPSTIVEAVMPIEKVTETSPEKLIAVLEHNLRWPRLDGGLEKEMLKARLENYNLAVTHLQNFLDVSRGGPQYFKERNLLRLPEAKTASLSYGTAMHAALDFAQKLVNKGEFDIARVEASYDKALNDEQLLAVDYERYLTKGRQTLRRLFSDYEFSLPNGSQSELNFRDIVSGSARIGGKLDRVDADGKNLLITDYKTGSPLNSFNTKDKNKAIKVYKHKMQLIFYALMAAEQFDAQAGDVQGQMIYLDADSKKNLTLSYTPTQADIEHLQCLIDAVWHKIQTLDLPNTDRYSPDIEGIRDFEADLLK
jgi:DNA helicase-2/ATP-dependent DNA helicase PcrA